MENKPLSLSKLKHTILAVALSSAVTSTGLQAAIFNWASGVDGYDTTTDDWGTVDNWYEDGPTTNTPGATDDVRISNDLFTNVVSPMPVIYSDVGSIAHLILGYNTAGQLSLFDPGRLIVSGNAYIGNQGAGTLNLLGDSYFQAGNLIFGNQSGITGSVELSGSSIIRAETLTYNGDTASTITLSDNSIFRLNGDQTAAGLENNRIVASVGTISAVFDSGDGFTAYTVVVVPEPGTYALLSGLTGLAFVMLRRRR